MSSPGWYPDPSDGTQLRYWDGTEWTDHRHPADAVPTAEAPEAPEASDAPEALETPEAAPAPPLLDPAHTSLLLGILSLVLCGFFTGVPAMIIAHRVRREIDESDGEPPGRGVARAGFLTGLIGTILSGVFLVFVVGVLLFGAALNNSFDDDCGKVTSSGTLSGHC